MSVLGLARFLLNISCWASALHASSSQARELIACGHPYYPPVSWVQEQQLIGIAPTVVKQIFGELGYLVRFDPVGNWKRCLREVKDGHADIVVAAYRIASREPDFSFSEQHIVADPIGLFVNPNQQSNYHSLNDLKGKTVGLLFGDSFGDRLDSYLAAHTNIQYVSQGQQNLAKLADQRIDFMPLGIVSGQLQTKKFGYSAQIIVAPLKLATEYYYLALGRHSKLAAHMPYINRRLSELNSGGEIQKLQTKYSKIYLESSNKVDIDNESP